MEKTIKEIASITNKNRLAIILDILKCHLKYKSTYDDYLKFQFYKKDAFERNTFLTQKKNDELIKKYNNPKFTKNLNTSWEFNMYFDKFLLQDYLILNKRNKKEFIKFCTKYKKILAKSKNKQLGHIDMTNQNVETLYNELKKFDRLVIENELENPHLKKLINDYFFLKTITISGSIIAANLEKGTLKNISIAPIDIENGTLLGPFLDNNNKEEDIDYQKIKIPYWEKIKKLCEDASLEIPEVGYIEWTISLGPTSPTLVSASSTPDYQKYQTSPIRNKNVGLIPIIKQREERKF